MSFVLDLQRAVLYSNMPDTARLIVLTLSVKADFDTGVIPDRHSPSLETLAAMTGLAKSTVAEWLDPLETAGWVKRERPDKASKYTKTRYTLLIGSPTVAAPQRASRRKTTQAATAVDHVTSPPGGPLTEPDAHAAVPSDSRPPGGPVRQADRSSSPPSGTPAVRRADGSSPPGGPATTKNSPTGSSPPKDVLGHPRTAAPSAAAHRRPTGGRRRSTPEPQDIPLPAGFAPTDAMIAWTRVHTPNVGLAETDSFVDYYRSLSGDGALRKDREAWVATWRRWMRKAQADIERMPGFRGKAVQTAVAPVAAPPPAAEPMCPRHPGIKARYCCPGSVPTSARSGRAASQAQGGSRAGAA